jgi:hypothetical protein
MTSQRVAELLLRRQRLVLRNAELRVILARQAQVLVPPLALADRSLSALLWLRHHPVWPLGLMLFVAVTRPRSVVRWAGKLLWGWGVYQRIRAPLHALTSHRP